MGTARIRRFFPAPTAATYHDRTRDGRKGFMPYRGFHLGEK